MASNQVQILSGVNPPINSNVNTIGRPAPSSRFLALPAALPLQLKAVWTEMAETGRSGVAECQVYISQRSGPYSLRQCTSASHLAAIGVKGKVDSRVT